MSSTIIICEKPDAMERIAAALAESNLTRRTSKYGVDFYEFFRGGKNFIAVCAVGHLFNLKQKGRGVSPAFDAEWTPSCFSVKKAYYTAKYYDTLEWIAQRTEGSDLISACDYDNEGSLIAWNIIKFIFNREDAGRMKFSTLTKQDLVSAYENMSPHIDASNIAAGDTRHYLDWIYGINTSRSLTNSVKKMSKRFSLLTAGRVQAPTLVILADRENEIKSFVPVPYWQIQLTALKDGMDIIALYEEENIWEKSKAEKIFEECRGKTAVVDSIESKKYYQNPPAPFNITSLQTEAYRLFGYSPQQTMSIAQSLYTRAYISYPRTSSERLPPQIGYEQILEALSKIEKYKPLCKALLTLKTLKPVEGKLTDPAHEAIHPTVEPPQDLTRLRESEQRIYDLVCRRYFATFAAPALREAVHVLIKINGHNFLANGRRTIEKGWMRFYGPYTGSDEMILPNLSKGEVLNVKGLDLLSKETLPPSRFSQASIIKEMERRGLGTRATRSNILQTLYDRNYIIDRRICVTDLGLRLAGVIKKYVPDFANEKLTEKFDSEMEKIAEGKGDKDRLIDEAKKAIVTITEEFKEHEDEIGKELGEAIVQTEDEKAALGECPNCGGELKIIYSPLTKKSFVGCSSYSKCSGCGSTKAACKCDCPVCGRSKGKCKCNWKEKMWTPKCQTIYPLPRSGKVQSTGKTCEKCRTPIIKVLRGRYSFSMCLDPKCETKADWGKPKERASKRKAKDSD